MGLEIGKKIVLGSLWLQMLETQLVLVKQWKYKELQLQPETVSNDVNIYSIPLSLSTLSFSWALVSEQHQSKESSDF